MESKQSPDAAEKNSSSSPKKPPPSTDAERPQQTPHPRPVSEGLSRVPSAGLIFLFFNSAVAVYRARDNPWLVGFVVASFADLLLLFYCLHLYETAPRSSPRRAQLRTAVWGLATLLTVMFSHRVAAMMPLPVAIIVWCAAATTIGLGFYWFFVCPHDTASSSSSSSSCAGGAKQPLK